MVGNSIFILTCENLTNTREIHTNPHSFYPKSGLILSTVERWGGPPGERGVDGSAATVRLLPKLHRMVSLGAPFDAQPLACPWGASPSDRTILSTSHDSSSSSAPALCGCLQGRGTHATKTGNCMAD